jgi:hypothetical protein
MDTSAAGKTHAAANKNSFQALNIEIVRPAVFGKPGLQIIAADSELDIE